MDLINLIREKIPKIAFSSDFIAGFCDETEEQFNDTLTLIETVKYDMAYLFAYSMRDKTHAYHKLQDNVQEEIKKRRLSEMIEIFRKNSKEKNLKEKNSYHLILVEGQAKRQSLKDNLVGRTDTNKLCIFPNEKISSEIPEFLFLNLEKNLKKFVNKIKSKSENFKDNKYFENLISLLENDKNKINLYDYYFSEEKENIKNNKNFYIPENNVFYSEKNCEIKIGDYIIVKINQCGTNTLFGTPVCKIDKLSQFFQISEGNPFFSINRFDDPRIYNSNTVFQNNSNNK